MIRITIIIIKDAVYYPTTLKWETKHGFNNSTFSHQLPMKDIVVIQYFNDIFRQCCQAVITSTVNVLQRRLRNIFHMLIGKVSYLALYPPLNITFWKEWLIFMWDMRPTRGLWYAKASSTCYHYWIHMLKALVCESQVKGN